MKALYKYLLLIALFSIFGSVNAQEKKIVQFSGYIIAEGTDVAVPYVSIRNNSYGNEGFTANHEGFFSFVAHVGDVIELTSIGYRNVKVTIPNVSSDKYSTRIEMIPLIEELPVVTIGPPLPCARIEEFIMEFLALNIGYDDVLTAKRNLSPQAMAALSRIVPRSAEEIQAYSTMQRHLNMSNRNINPSMNNPLLNPFAWGSLINQIKRGDFSRQRLKY